MIECLEVRYKTVPSVKFVPGEGYRIYAYVTPPNCYDRVATTKQVDYIKKLPISTKDVKSLHTLTLAQAWAIIGAGVIISNSPYEFYLILKIDESVPKEVIKPKEEKPKKEKPKKETKPKKEKVYANEISNEISNTPDNDISLWRKLKL